MVAYSFAANYPDATLRISLIDVAHPEESLYGLSLLTLAGERNYPYLRELLPTQATDVRVVKVNSSSHYVPEDQPEAVVRELLGFFRS